MRKKLYNLLLWFFAAVFAVSAVMLGWYFIDGAIQRNRYKALAELKQDQTPRPTAGEEYLPPETEPATVTVTDKRTGEFRQVLPEFAALFEQNPDIVGWLTIPGTVIDYPVMQTPDRPDYYLRRNFDGKKNTAGCLYAEEACDIFTPSDNITIYGHRMKNGSMFARLDNFMDADYCAENPYIFFDTLEALHTYQVMAVILTNVSLGNDFPYYQFVNAADQAQYDAFVAQCKARSLFDTGVNATYGDKLICLSTCEYSQTNGRLVIVAKRVG